MRRLTIAAECLNKKFGSEGGILGKLKSQKLIVLENSSMNLAVK